MRTESAPAASAARALEVMPFQDAVALARAHPDTPWLALALGAGAWPQDEGVYWVVLPGDLEVWPVRVLRVGFDQEAHLVWLTYRWPLGVDVEVMTQEGDPFLVPQLAGDQGRAALLGGFGQDATGGATP